MRAVKELLPQENIVYFGDTKNLPYGNKSADIILQHSLENTRFLGNLGIKLLIIACHTVCTTAYEDLKKAMEIPVIGMIEPSMSLLKKLHGLERIALLGTRRTVDSGVYQKALQEAEEGIYRVLAGDAYAELYPQRRHIRRLQHALVAKYGLRSESLGSEPQRRVRISRA